MIKKNTLVYSVAFLILAFILVIGLYLERENQHLQQAEVAEFNGKNKEIGPINLARWTKKQLAENDIEIKRAGPGQLKMYVPCSGNVVVHPDHLAHVVPKVSGIAKEIRKNLGDAVYAGEVMVVLESREIAGAKANYYTALAKERLSKATLERELRLYKKGISSEQEFLTAQNNYEKTKINLQLIKQKLQMYGLNDEEIYGLTFDNNSDFRIYEIRAPIDGTVIKRDISSGEFIQDSNTIYEIANLRKVWIEMGVYPQDLLNIKERQNIEIIAPIENQSGRGRLIYISPLIDEETLLIKAIAELDNSTGEWRAGTFVNIKIATEQVTVPLIVPKEALQYVEGEACIFVLNSRSIEKRFVKLGRTDQQSVEILSGLEPGEKYASNGAGLKGQVVIKQPTTEHKG